MSPLEQLRETLLQSVLDGAPALLGWDLVRGGLRARLVEVEAYRGADDPGSHAFRGPRPRTCAMFGPPGFAYVYFTYGNHWMLNVTAEPEGTGAAVLVRAAMPFFGIEAMRERRPKAKADSDLLSGPGKLAAAFAIDRALYGIDLLDPESELRLEPGEPPTGILVGTRIGLAKGQGDDLPWRFVDAGRIEWTSRPRTDLRPNPRYSAAGAGARGDLDLVGRVSR